MKSRAVDMIERGKEWLAGCRDDWRTSFAFRRAGPRIGWCASGAGAAVRVSYGLATVPRPEDRAGGGIIKVRDLAAEFPDHPEKANVLYLVSSALPPYAPWLARQAKAAGARVVLNQNGVAYPAWHGPGWRMTNRPLQQVLRTADHVFYQSRFCWMSADRFLGRARGTSEVLYNAVDTARFTPRPGLRPAQPFTLLLAGSHLQPYRMQTALQTLVSVRAQGIEAKLLLAGRLAWRSDERQAQQDMDAMVDALNIRPWVECVGPYSQMEAVPLLQRADILLHPLYNDPCPRLVVEAMSCGVPVVYSATGGVPELVGENAGVGVPASLDWVHVHPPSPHELAAAVAVILQNWDTFSRAARARAVAQFDVRAWIERHRHVFDALCCGTSGDRTSLAP